jgi:Glycosyltransferase family 87
VTQAAFDAAPQPNDWRRALRHGAFAYALSRVLVFVGVGVVAAAKASALAEQHLPKPKSAFRSMIDALGSWDGTWYVRVAQLGYPDRVPAHITYGQVEARAAFFPLFPWVIRVVNHVIPGDIVMAALVTNIVLGGVFVYLVGRIARRVFDDEVARQAMVLTALFPGSVVFSFAYAEALLLVLATGCLLALLQKRWWLAGVLGALATFTRPNGIAVVAACVAAAVVAWRRDREWRAAVAAVLSPLGFVAFQLYIGVHAHERGVWFRVQREAWREGTSYGGTALRSLSRFLLHPFSSPTNAVTAASVVVLVVGLVALRRARLPAPLVAYALASVVLMLLPATITARPRFLTTAFPLAIAAAVVWPGRRRDSWSYVTAICGAGLVTLAALYGLSQVVIP